MGIKKNIRHLKKAIKHLRCDIKKIKRRFIADRMLFVPEAVNHTFNYYNNKQKCMKQITLNNQNPSARLKLQPVNKTGAELGKTNPDNGANTLIPGTLQVNAPGDVTITFDQVDQTVITITKNGTTASQFTAVATALNEKGEVISSDELSVTIEADGGGTTDNIAASLVWKDADGIPGQPQANRNNPSVIAPKEMRGA